MYTQTLLPTTFQAVRLLSTAQCVQPFYLSGGTALALQIGHRESEDLDFFCPEIFEPVRLQTALTKLGTLESVELAQGTLNCFLDSVKLQFLHYPYPLLKDTVIWENIALSSVIDIACTKIITISMRGSKKDFIDLYFILQQFSLSEIFHNIEKKYYQVGYSREHLLKSLVYFDDAVTQPMPRMHENVTWQQVMETITQHVKDLPLF